MKNLFHFKKLFIVCCCAILSGCITTGYRDEQKKLSISLYNNDYSTALSVVNDEGFLSEKRSILLKYLEKGTVNYLAGNYYQALKDFDEAEKISEELYTISVSAKLKSSIDDNLDNYYGERYERSLLRFYKSIVNYNLYRIGKYESYTKDKKIIPEKILTEEEKFEHLRRSRSNILEWGSLLDSYTNETAGKAEYKADILEKIWGAFIFEENKDQFDISRSKVMYRNSKNILLKNYNIYPTFNNKHKEFEKNFDKLHKMDINYVKNKFVKKTNFAKELEDFIDKKINAAKQDNLFIILKENFVPPKKAEVIKIPIMLSYFANMDNTFLNFVNLLGIFGDDKMFYAELEIPYIEKKTINNKIVAKILDKNRQEVKSFPIVLINPMSNIALNEFEEERSALIAKLTATTVAKYTTALTVAYQIYNTNQNNALVLLLSLGSYKAAEKTIRETSKADLRYWSTLADNFRIGTINLKNGDYILEIYSIDDSQNKKKIYEENIKIRNETNFLDINLP